MYSLLVASILSLSEVTAERFPDADSVIIDESERVKYAADGTYEVLTEEWSKILTEKGRRESSKAEVNYSKRYGEAEILYVGIIGTNGVERQVDVSGTTKESTDNGSMGMNIYDPLDRTIVATIPGLEIGDTLHTKMRRKTTKPRCQNQWYDMTMLEWTRPILRSTYEITAPPELPLKKIAVRHPLGNVAESRRQLADGSTVHTIVATNSPQVFPEPDMPPLFTQVQHVRASTAESWPEISRWYWDLCAPHLAKTSAAMTNLVQTLTAGAKNDEMSKVRAIFKFVSQEIRYMGLTMEDTSPGYAPHDVDITFDNRYGVCRDKAGLLVALLRIAGFQAYPVLIHVGAKLDPEIPQPFFNHAVVAVEGAGAPKGERYLLMDPTNENAKDIFPAYLGDASYIVARPDGDELRRSPVTPPEHNALSIASKGQLAKDGSLYWESDLAFGGINDTVYRGAMVKWKPEDRIKFFERVVRKSAPGAELIKCEIEPKDMRDTDSPIRVKLAVKLPEMVLHGESRDELNVPFLSLHFGFANFLLEGSTSLVTRRFPLVVDSTARVDESIEIDLGGHLGATLDIPPKMSLTQGGYRFEREFSVRDGVLKAHRRLDISAVEFSPKEYADLRESIKSVEANERHRPIFALDSLAEADVRYLLESSEATIRSDREWVVTNTIVKEVLTYDGKKKSAEIKFNYHPAWKNIEIVTATVSNQNGEVKSVSAKEQNVMDADWAREAPRYPAGKLLVVNLPSVEIGSVITLQTVTTVTNAPLPFYATYGFDSTEPLERRVVRVNDWYREVENPKRIPNEPGQPSASFWRDQAIVSSNDFGKAAVELRRAAEIVDIDDDDIPEELRNEKDFKEIRKWMAKKIRVCGPSLYQLPIDAQLTNPATVLKESYASRLDYVRTMAALLKRAGYDVDIVFAALDSDEHPDVRNRIMHEKPNVSAFASALCRVRIREGGFLWFGGEERVYFFGTENQYAEVGTTAFDDCDYFDPESETFDIVKAVEMELKHLESEETVFSVRENGDVDLNFLKLYFGSGVAAFRKRYEEMLPEELHRHYQEILGNVSQSASATSELETNVNEYPASMSFKCYIPNFATVSGDMITLQLPEFLCSVPDFTGSTRKTPFAVGAAKPSLESVSVIFPKGWTIVEHLPEPFVFIDPQDPMTPWMSSTVETKINEEGQLVVTLERTAFPRHYSWYPSAYIELVKDWNRLAKSRANRTISVRLAE